jgi:hypothetical protein
MAAIATLNASKNQVGIFSKLLLYGSEANDETGTSIINEINRMYNEPEVSVPIGSQDAKVFFSVTYELISIAEAVDLASTNQDFQNNFIRIEAKNVLTRSFMGFGLGDNSGHWLTSDQLGISTTAAHEFGHGLGLDHPPHNDYCGTNMPPPIMAPRGSLVDPQYQWSPLAKAGEFGGTMNPIYRKVTKEEIGMIIEGLSFETTDTYYIGYLSNKLFDFKGQVSRERWT